MTRIDKIKNFFYFLFCSAMSGLLGVVIWAMYMLAESASNGWVTGFSLAFSLGCVVGIVILMLVGLGEISKTFKNINAKIGKWLYTEVE